MTRDNCAMFLDKDYVTASTISSRRASNTPGMLCTVMAMISSSTLLQLTPLATVSLVSTLSLPPSRALPCLRRTHTVSVLPLGLTRDELYWMENGTRWINSNTCLAVVEQTSFINAPLQDKVLLLQRHSYSPASISSCPLSHNLCSLDFEMRLTNRMSGHPKVVI